MRHLFHQWRQLNVWYALHKNGYVSFVRFATLNGKKYNPSRAERRRMAEDLEAYHRDNI